MRNQSLISKVTKKRVGINLKIFVFALLKTVQNQAERNSGRILRLFNCNDRGFLLLREAPKPKFLPGLVNVFYDILERKKAFLSYKNNQFKQSKKFTFIHGFGPKMASFANFSV